MLLQKIDIPMTGHHYPIYIGESLIEDAAFFKPHIHGKQVMIVSNPTVAPLFLKKLQHTLNDFSQDYVLLPEGESHKNLDSFQKITDALAAKKHHRDSTLITLGGGVIGDVGGFAAACYQRGMGLIHIPTTLLAQVDASIGGKVAVNHTEGKNLIGTFYQPEAVIIDLNTLTTLPQRAFRAGLAEIVKAAVIWDADFFSWLEENTENLLMRKKPVLLTALTQACLIKKNIVIFDEKEKNSRALLNFGHTFAHAIEHAQHYDDWLHGEAVAVGIVLAAQLSHQLQRFTRLDYERIRNLLANLQLPINVPEHLPIESLLQAMQLDKKIKRNQPVFILLNALGSAVICDTVTIDDLKRLSLR